MAFIFKFFMYYYINAFFKYYLNIRITFIDGCCFVKLINFNMEN